MKFQKTDMSFIVAIMCVVMLFSGCTLTSKNDTSKNSVTTQNTADLHSSQQFEQADVCETPEPASNNSDTSEKGSDDSKKAAPTKSTITPAVWEVTDSDGNSIYMMGSIHVADIDATVMPDYFESAYAKCDSLAVECDTTDTVQTASEYRQMIYADGSTIKDHVSKESYDKIVELLKKEGASQSDKFKPIIWTTLLESIGDEKAGLSSEYGIDDNLIFRAKREGKDVLEVESFEFQADILYNLPEEMQNMFFEDWAYDNALEDYAEGLLYTYDKWKSGTLNENDVIASDIEIEEELSEEDTEEYNRMKELYEEYNKIILYDRNIGMADKAMEYMKDGKKVMFVVGATHFYGDKGILKLMENAGCTVRRLTADDVDTDINSNESTPEETVPDTETYPAKAPKAA